MNRPLAIVTGANRGLGLGTARELAGRGYRVLMLGRDAAAIREAAEGLPADADVVPMTVDVTEPEAIAMLADRLGHHEGPVEILVNNAGILPSEDDAATIERTFAINTLGPYRLIQAVAPHMRPGGRIVNVSSGMGQLSEMGSGYPAYRISKTALNAVTRYWANELAERGIHVNSVCPGWVRTRMGGEHATRSLKEGISGIVWAATLPGDGPSGGFFRDGEPIDW